jgi:hypothetical protein
LTPSVPEVSVARGRRQQASAEQLSALPPRASPVQPYLPLGAVQALQVFARLPSRFPLKITTINTGSQASQICGARCTVAAVCSPRLQPKAANLDVKENPKLPFILPLNA